jgi:predicted Rossmann-fold nucleotide-binding protein
VSGYFDALLTWVEHTVAEGFMRTVHRQLLLEAKQPEELLDRLLNYRPPEPTPKWIQAEDR